MNQPPSGDPAGDPGSDAPREPRPEPPHHRPQEPPSPHAPPEEGAPEAEEPHRPQEPQAPSDDPYAAPQGPPGGPHQPAAPHGEPVDPHAPAYRPRHAPPREDDAPGGADPPPGADADQPPGAGTGPPPPASGLQPPAGWPDGPAETGHQRPYGGFDPGEQEPYRAYRPFAPPGSTAAALGLRPADWWQRLIARIVDALVVVIPIFIVLFAVLITWVLAAGPGRALPAGPFAAGAGENLLLDAVSGILVCALLVAYETWMLTRWGATLGKMAMGLRVIPLHAPEGGGVRRGPEGTGLAGQAALVRALVWWGPAGLNWLPVLGALIALFPFLNGLWPLWDRPEQQSLNDKAARTIVIREH
ncbi:RDD family protein [Nocardiopsis sediminis]|uniref:RDD family protein n=1 Tax=Nocardiopsis sediminis TaxID=1778267 RepID=A0ABV8FT27_9ACTN